MEEGQMTTGNTVMEPAITPVVGTPPPPSTPPNGAAQLQAGDVLSYSAGSTQTGPFGYRKLQNRGGLLAATVKRWPDLKEALGTLTPLFINAYPASVGFFQGGISIDTYLSPRVMSRALQLGRLGGHPTIVLAQPLFLVDVLLRHVALGHPLPEELMLWTGGYPLPSSLERMLRGALEPHVRRLWILQYFGAAEVDAACLMARQCNAEGLPIFYPRDDVRVEQEGDQLLLTLLDSKGIPSVERFPTGDRVRPAGDGWLIDNPRRLHPHIAAAFKSWSNDDWQRRTGYVARADGQLWMQLREGLTDPGRYELEHFEFAHRFGFSWLNKPNWN